MPIFSYVCKDCNAKFDLFLRGSQTSDKLACIKCGSKNIQKTFSPFGIGSKSSSDSDNSQSTCPTGTCPF
jgi:putative FmdB family regulatory protein